MPTHIERFISQYFKYQPFFVANDMGRTISPFVSAAGKKRDLSRYLGWLGRYLKQCPLLPLSFSWIDKRDDLPPSVTEVRQAPRRSPERCLASLERVDDIYNTKPTFSYLYFIIYTVYYEHRICARIRDISPDIWYEKNTHMIWSQYLISRALG